jgi:hypothetical protein
VRTELSTHYTYRLATRWKARVERAQLVSAPVLRSPLFLVPAAPEQATSVQPRMTDEPYTPVIARIVVAGGYFSARLTEWVLLGFTSHTHLPLVRLLRPINDSTSPPLASAAKATRTHRNRIGSGAWESNPLSQRYERCMVYVSVSTRPLIGAGNTHGEIYPHVLYTVGYSWACCRVSTHKNWLRERDLNPRPFGYEPNELPDCSTPL